MQFNADSNSRDEEGRTPLVLAVRLGSCEAVQILLQQNATAQTLQVEDRQSWQHEESRTLGLGGAAPLSVLPSSSSTRM